MISVSQLSPEQIETIKSWAEDGAQLSDIQKRLGEDLGLSATYMDTRFLILDLGIELHEDAPAEEEKVDLAEVEAVTPDAVAEGVSVQLDQITKPGAMVSGRITFSDGERGMWWIDSTGRPGLDTETAEYRPSEEDMMAFEMELRRLLEGGGA